MEQIRLQKIDESLLPLYSCLDNTDNCYFLGEYASGQGLLLLDLGWHKRYGPLALKKVSSSNVPAVKTTVERGKIFIQAANLFNHGQIIEGQPDPEPN